MNKNRGNELPIHDIKNYERSIIASYNLFSVNDKNEINYVLHRMRRSKTDSELYDSRKYIYNENEPECKSLNKNQVKFLEKMASDLDLEYLYHEDIRIHALYKFDFSDISNLK